MISAIHLAIWHKLKGIFFATQKKPTQKSPAQKRALWLSVLLLVVFVLPAVFAPWLTPYLPSTLDLEGSLNPPSVQHWLGQDDQGADILSRLLYGARISLLVGISTAACSAIVGVLLGISATLLGGVFEQALMRVVDVLLAFPGLLLAIAIVAVLGAGMWNVVLALSVLGWTGFARLARAQTLVVQSADYLLSAQAAGARMPRVIRYYVLPNIAAPLLVQISFATAVAILAEASLSFLGLGVPPEVPSWGSMIAEGRHVLDEAFHVSFFPGLAIVVVVLLLNLLGDSLADWLDPKRQQLGQEKL